MKKLIYFILLFSLVCLSCDKKEELKKDFPNKLEESELIFENKSLVKSYKDCRPTSENCSYILFEYERISDGDFKDEINNTIDKELISISQEFLESKNSNSLEEVCECFLNEYKDYKIKNKSRDVIWTMEIRGKRENYTPKVLSYSISNVNFLGGAHPNTKFKYINFDRKSGKLLSLNDIFIIGFEKKLNMILDKIIRQNYMLKPEDNLSEKIGLFENKIEYTNNFAITKHGIKFYYNPLEIAPYSVGFIELIIPYSELEEILTPNSKARP